MSTGSKTLYWTHYYYIFNSGAASEVVPVNAKKCKATQAQSLLASTILSVITIAGIISTTAAAGAVQRGVARKHPEPANVKHSRSARLPPTSEVRMRRIGLAVVLAVSLTLAPFAEAQRVPEVGVLILGTERLSLNAERLVPSMRSPDASGTRRGTASDRSDADVRRQQLLDVGARQE